jgi:hypothetical protein
MSNAIGDPTGRSVSAMMYTPAALMSAVVALSSPLLLWILMGSSSGKRFPVLASDIGLLTNTPNPRKGALQRVEKQRRRFIS